MSTKTDPRIALGIPAMMMLAPLATYYLCVAIGVDRTLALDSATVGIMIGAVGVLRGVHQAPQRTWSLELGALLGVLVAVAGLALRAVTLAPSGGLLFYFSITSSAGLGYAAHRMLRRILAAAARGVQ